MIGRYSIKLCFLNLHDKLYYLQRCEEILRCVWALSFSVHHCCALWNIVKIPYIKVQLLKFNFSWIMKNWIMTFDYFFPRLELNNVYKVLEMGLPIILWIFDGEKMRPSGSSNTNHRQNIEFPIWTWSPNLKMLIPPVDMSCRRAMPAENVDRSDVRPILNPLRLTHGDTGHRLLDTDSGHSRLQRYLSSWHVLQLSLTLIPRPVTPRHSLPRGQSRLG